MLQISWLDLLTSKPVFLAILAHISGTNMSWYD